MRGANINTLNYAAISVSEELIRKKAEKYRRLRNFYQRGKKLIFDSPDPRGIGSLPSAFYFLLFPITYPIFLLKNPKNSIEKISLLFWPFYNVKVDVSNYSGVQTVNTWVEGMVDGLSRGIYDASVSGERYLYKETEKSPYFFFPKSIKKWRIINDSLPIGAILMSFMLNESNINEYVLDDLVEKGRIVNSEGVRSVRVKSIERFYLPIWVVRYAGRKLTSYMTLGAIDKKLFHRMEISSIVLDNPQLSERL